MIRDADGFKHLCEVVRHQSIVRPWRKQRNTCGNKDASSVSRRLQKLDPLSLQVGHLVLDALSDLLDFHMHEIGLDAFAVVFDEDVLRFLVAALGGIVSCGSVVGSVAGFILLRRESVDFRGTNHTKVKERREGTTSIREEFARPMCSAWHKCQA